MVHVGNIEGNYTFLQIQCRESACKFSAMNVLHDTDGICPRNIFWRDWFCGIQSGGLCLKLVLKYFLSGFASILVLIADKKDIHNANYCSGDI